MTPIQIVGYRLIACFLLETALSGDLQIAHPDSSVLEDQSPDFYLYISSIVHPRFPFDYQHSITLDP